VVGKPLPDVGTVAERGRLYRPTGFETAADIVMMLGGSNDEQGIANVNEHFWRKFRKADLSQTILGVTYMRQDDYQPNGFDRIYHQLSTQNSPVQFLHKGWIGRHNDNTGGIVQWFVQIIRLILKTRYGREE
jgi:accessory secretory protein Asp2